MSPNETETEDKLIEISALGLELWMYNWSAQEACPGWIRPSSLMWTPKIVWTCKKEWWLDQSDPLKINGLIGRASHTRSGQNWCGKYGKCPTKYNYTENNKVLKMMTVILTSPPCWSDHHSPQCPQWSTLTSHCSHVNLYKINKLKLKPQEKNVIRKILIHSTLEKSWIITGCTRIFSNKSQQMANLAAWLVYLLDMYMSISNVSQAEFMDPKSILYFILVFAHIYKSRSVF